MDDFMDLSLLKYFEDQVEHMEKPESEPMGKMPPYQGNMAHLTSLFSSADELIKAMEIEIFERSLEENKD